MPGYYSGNRYGWLQWQRESLRVKHSGLLRLTTRCFGKNRLLDVDLDKVLGDFGIYNLYTLSFLN